MKIVGISDLHGYLPENIKKCDILIIAGDLFPLNCQCDIKKCEEWFNKTFCKWCNKVDASIIIVVAGNHDFYFEKNSQKHIYEIIASNNLINKVIYLQDEMYEYNGLKIYGCPWCTGPNGWAFSPNQQNADINLFYQAIPDCDILICHQPPKIDKVGCSYPYKPYEIDYGSYALRSVIEQKNIKYVFCGHIHSGIHGGVEYNNTMIYNVSLKDEDYRVDYKPTEVII